MEQEIKGKVREFLSGTFKNYDLKDDEDIFKLGFVNSLFAMQLVNFVEKEFEITVENEDLDIKNFNSIQSLTDLVMRKKN